MTSCWPINRGLSSPPPPFFCSPSSTKSLSLIHRVPFLPPLFSYCSTIFTDKILSPPPPPRFSFSDFSVLTLSIAFATGWCLQVVKWVLVSYSRGPETTLNTILEIFLHSTEGVGRGTKKAIQKFSNDSTTTTTYHWSMNSTLSNFIPRICCRHKYVRPKTIKRNVFHQYLLDTMSLLLSNNYIKSFRYEQLIHVSRDCYWIILQYSSSFEFNPVLCTE